MNKTPAILLSIAMCAGAAATAQAANDASPPPYTEWTRVDDGIPEPLGGLDGNPDRGRRLAVDPRKGNCLACHQVPIPDEEFQGDLGPPLAGVASRLSGAQLRLRVVDEKQLNPGTVMPGYYRDPAQFRRVPEKFRGRTWFTPQEIEDVVAWLQTLKD